jgi:hypothetical protein
MDIRRAKKIHLDRKAGGVEYEPGDWTRTGPRQMHHEPTQTIFEVAPDKAAMKRGSIGLFDVSAKLVHVCDGCKIPSQTEQVELGRTAIAVYLQGIGMWKPDVTKHVHQPPKLTQ